jgi:NADH-quinone oxidoreductase subunit M
MLDLPLLSIITFLPLVGVFFIAMIKGKPEDIANNSRLVALWVSGLVFLLSLLMVFGFEPLQEGFQFEEQVAWFPAYNISYHMGVDGLSVLFVLLSAFLIPICILSSWHSVQKRVREYMIMFLMMETFMIGMFCALDFLCFYIFFEAVLIPMYLIIGIWGGENRIYASFKFFLYTLIGSVLMLLAIIAMYFNAGTTDIVVLLNTNLPESFQIWLWLAFFASFAVKVPMWPVHTWLPDAHVQAPTAGSVILAGVLLKMGGYGFLRFSIPMLPIATDYFTPFIFTLSVIAVIYTSLVAFVQTDMKKLIAYSSIAHMGFVTIGLFTLTMQGMQGAIYQMLSHGIVSSALFLLVGVVYDRLHTKEIARYGGLVNIMPRYAFVFMIMMLASVGLPITSGFVGEFLVLVGAYQVSQITAILATSGVVLGAAYMLYLYRRVIFGKLVHKDLKTMLDLKKIEIAMFVPLVFLVFLMGIYPNLFLDIMAPSVDQLINNYKIALMQGNEFQLSMLFN